MKRVEIPQFVFFGHSDLYATPTASLTIYMLRGTNTVIWCSSAIKLQPVGQLPLQAAEALEVWLYRKRKIL